MSNVDGFENGLSYLMSRIVFLFMQLPKKASIDYSLQFFFSNVNREDK
jgi:hypothetical protein